MNPQYLPPQQLPQGQNYPPSNFPGQNFQNVPLGGPPKPGQDLLNSGYRPTNSNTPQLVPSNSGVPSQNGTGQSPMKPAGDTSMSDGNNFGLRQPSGPPLGQKPLGGPMGQSNIMPGVPPFSGIPNAGDSSQNTQRLQQFSPNQLPPNNFNPNQAALPSNRGPPSGNAPPVSRAGFPGAPSPTNHTPVSAHNFPGGPPTSNVPLMGGQNVPSAPPTNNLPAGGGHNLLGGQSGQKPGQLPPGQSQPPNQFAAPTIGQPLRPPASANSQINDARMYTQQRMPLMPGQVPGAIGQMPPAPGQSSQMPPLPGQSNQMPPLPGQSNQMPPLPGQSNQMPPLPGQTNQMPPLPGQSNQMPPLPAQSNQMPPLPGQSNQMPPLPGQSNQMPQLPGQGNQMPPLPGQSSQMPPLPGQGNQMPPLPGQMGQISPQRNQRPPMPGQNVHTPGQMPTMSSQRTNIPGQMPPMPGQMPPLQGQRPPIQGQLPPMQNQMPPMQNQMPPMPGQTHHMPGQMPPMQINGPNQLASQIQGMNLNGPQGGPHMPPPLNQGAYNTQSQMRSPQGGYPQAGGGGYASQSGYPQQPIQQQKRLDPDQMPSPIQVIMDDQQNRSGPFITNQKGLVPPLVTTNFVVQDQGNASPRFIRSTMYNVPISQDLMKQTSVPFSLIISPMARLGDEEFAPPIVNFGELGPIRCIRCKAYMCPYMQFIDSGRRIQCLFCKATTDVPAEYFQHLDHTGQRMDKYERPELVLGTYEFVATADYCRNNTLPKPPAIIFVIDVSYNNIKSGLVQLLCTQMKEIIQNLPVDQGHEKSNMKVGFITYNSSVHFYNIKGSLAAPQMMVVGDTQEMFMPLLDGFLCTPEESGIVIDALMEQIPLMFRDTKETEIVLLPAILAGLEALKASECAGKLMVFHSTLPTGEAPGKLKNRDDRKLLGTDKEKTVLSPQTQAYNQLGQDCVAAGCCVDLFLFNNSFIDIATIGQVSRLTGGEVFKYTYFQADIDGERLIKDIIMDISRPIAFDGIMRVRTSTGVRPTDFYGHFFMSNTTDMELAAIDCDKGVAVEIKHDDKLSEEEGVYIQAALLYTSCSGQRRLRVMNLSLKTCSQMADLYRCCDLDTIVNYVAKQSTFKLLDNSPKAVKDAIVNRAVQILASYRKNCATPSSAGQLILPECMKLLPLYVNCLLKSDALSGGSDMTIDDRAFAMQAVMTMDVPTSVNYFYPRLIPLHELDSSKDPNEIPLPIRCTIDKMNEQGVYLLENGIHMFLWVGLGASPEFVQKVFGAPSAIQIDIDRPFLPELDNPLSVAVRNIIDDVRIQRHRCMRLTVVRQREKLEPVFKHFLVEDRGADGSASYVDFLCHMHKEIRNLLS